jgi:poly(A) polymerase
VPEIQTIFSGIHVDLAMARLPLATVQDDLDLYDNRILQGLDDASVRSLNGVSALPALAAAAACATRRACMCRY